MKKDTKFAIWTGLFAIWFSVFLFGLVYEARSAEVSLAWDDMPVETWATRVYIGLSPGNYQWSLEVPPGITQTTVPNLLPGKTYFFSAKSFEGPMESLEFSNEISTAIPAELTIFPNLPPLDETVKTYQITIRQVPAR